MCPIMLWWVRPAPGDPLILSTHAFFLSVSSFPFLLLIHIHICFPSFDCSVSRFTFYFSISSGCHLTSSLANTDSFHSATVSSMVFPTWFAIFFFFCLGFCFSLRCRETRVHVPKSVNRTWPVALVPSALGLYRPISSLVVSLILIRQSVIKSPSHCLQPVSGSLGVSFSLGSTFSLLPKSRMCLRAYCSATTPCVRACGNNSTDVTGRVCAQSRHINK